MDALQFAVMRARMCPHPKATNGNATPDLNPLEQKIEELSVRLKALEAKISANQPQRPTAESVADQTKPTLKPRPPIGKIRRMVAEYYGLSEEELCGPSRSGRLMVPRHVAYYLASKLTLKPLTVIAEHLGKCDHSTILHGRDKIALRLSSDDALRAEVEMLEEKIKAI